MKKMIFFISWAAFACPPLVLLSQTISGVIDYPLASSCSNSSYCCPYPPSTSPVANVKVEAVNLVTGATEYDVTDASGNFSVFVGSTGTLQLTPMINDPNWLNGVSTFDLIKLQQFLNGSEQLRCAFRRIAADVDYDGDIDSDDQAIIQNLILGNITTFSEVPNWNSVSKTIVDDFPLHPLINFFNALVVEVFWNIPSSVPGHTSPFDFTSGLTSHYDINYFGTPSDSTKSGISFVQSLDYFPLRRIGKEDCSDEIPMGFYIFKSGDISGNASRSFSPPARHSISPSIRTRLESSALIKARSKEKTLVTVSAKSDQPILGWQMGFQINTQEDQLKIKTNKGAKELRLDKNFGIKTIKDNHTAMRVLWFAQNENDALNIKETTELFSFEISGDFSRAEMERLIMASTEVLTPEFTDINENNVTEEVEVIIRFQ